MKSKDLDEEDVAEIIRQQPNFKTLGFKLKLMAFNAVDSAKVAEKRIRKNEKLHAKNDGLKAKQERINKRRIEKAREKNRDWYTQKIIPLKDTLEPRMFFREWLKYRIGKPPVIFDSTQFNKSIEQLAVYIQKKGFHYGNVSGEIDYKYKRRKVIANYYLELGERYYIDSVYAVATNKGLISDYNRYVDKGKVESLIDEPFDTELLDDYRYAIASEMRDNALYGFSYSNVNYIVDTTGGDFGVTVGIQFTDRLVKSSQYADSLIRKPHRTTFVRNAYFHIIDSLAIEGNFAEVMAANGLPRITNGFLSTKDTLLFQEVYLNNDEKKNRGIDIHKDTLNISRIAIFLYNEELFVDPAIIELQNYLEKENYYKEYYLERSYSRLLQSGLFAHVKPVLEEVEGTNYIDVHYYLVPAKRQSFSFEPRATNSNGFLGVSASVNYFNRNTFKKGEKFTFSVSGGFESQPPVFDESVDGEKIKQSGRSFNTFEIGPSVKFEIPGLIPIRRAAKLAKRQNASTVMSTAFNFQNRSDFSRKIFQFNYHWRFRSGKAQVFQLGFPTTSVIKYVDINKTFNFQSKIDALNDLFLRNAYSNQFIWQDWQVSFEYNSREETNKKSKSDFYYKGVFDPAGNFLSLFNKYLDTTDTGQKAIFKVGYSQFVRLDNEFIFVQPTGKKKSINARLQFGGGQPYGNSKTSLPYDYGFFGGGANDNRGWRSRSLGPGSYKYYLDTNRTATQIGDIRIGASFEYRFSLGGMFQGALFSDAGNIWTWNEDLNRPGAKFSSDWYKEIAVSAGLGLRVDLDFFIIRVDMGVPLSNPALPKGSQWIFQSRDAFNQEILNTPDLDLSKVPRPFTPILHFGIGYPF